MQASYTWSKSIDDTSQVSGGTGSTGATAIPFPQDPYNTHPEKGPSNFDVTNAFTLSAAQDLHLDSINFLEAHDRKDHGGVGDAGYFGLSLAGRRSRFIRVCSRRAQVERCGPS